MCRAALYVPVYCTVRGDDFVLERLGEVLVPVLVVRVLERDRAVHGAPSTCGFCEPFTSIPARETETTPPSSTDNGSRVGCGGSRGVGCGLLRRMRHHNVVVLHGAWSWE